MHTVIQSSIDLLRTAKALGISLNPNSLQLPLLTFFMRCNFLTDIFSAMDSRRAFSACRSLRSRMIVRFLVSAEV